MIFKCTDIILILHGSNIEDKKTTQMNKRNI